MLIWRLIFLFLLVGIDLTLQGQSISHELKFARYLLGKSNYEESTYVLKNIDSLHASAEQRDSLHYLLGNLYYNQKNLTASIRNFDLVSSFSPRLRSEAIFFSSFNHAYEKHYSIARRKLLNYSPRDSTESQLRNLELAGVSLLQRDLKTYDSLAVFFKPVNYAIDLQEKKMQEHFARISHQKKKSPVVAAALSTILPGAGKFYAGNKGQAVYTLLISAVLGLQTLEGYHKDGPNSFRFIAYGTLFTSLYIGTIWGSTFTVKMKRDQLNETINDQILFDMHIPLRTVFH